ncbi:hypothetical protein CRG98_027722 [Punica granatum]|uniref:Uncharacterized protein n=1 Tax=Punica granatum TaxID=22663 RepID=A0A2I0J6L4_PUNGR|nr:hypothetical protein CRG98_027722 [Punica granatum]
MACSLAWLAQGVPLDYEKSWKKLGARLIVRSIFVVHLNDELSINGPFFRVEIHSGDQDEFQKAVRNLFSGPVDPQYYSAGFCCPEVCCLSASSDCPSCALWWPLPLPCSSCLRIRTSVSVGPTVNSDPGFDQASWGALDMKFVPEKLAETVPDLEHTLAPFPFQQAAVAAAAGGVAAEVAEAVAVVGAVEPAAVVGAVAAAEFGKAAAAAVAVAAAAAVAVAAAAAVAAVVVDAVAAAGVERSAAAAGAEGSAAVGAAEAAAAAAASAGVAALASAAAAAAAAVVAAAVAAADWVSVA